MNIQEPVTISFSSIINNLQRNVSNFFRYLRDLNQKYYTISQNHKELNNKIIQILNSIYQITNFENDATVEDVIELLQDLHDQITHLNDIFNRDYLKISNYIDNIQSNIMTINNDIQNIQRSSYNLQSKRYQINSLTKLFIENDQQLNNASEYQQYQHQLQKLIQNIPVLIDNTISNLMKIELIDYSSDIDDNEFDFI